MTGYAHLAALMAQQDEFAIFRSFKVLGLQDLLYLQAEITHVEEELQSLAVRDSTHPDRVYHTRDWWTLSQGVSETDTEQWEKVLELRSLLEKYREAPHTAWRRTPLKWNGVTFTDQHQDDKIIRQRVITNIKSPREYDLKFLREWFERPSMGAMPLLGLDRTSWDPPHEKDLVSLNPRIPPDKFSEWFSERLIPTFHRVWGTRLKVRDTNAEALHGPDQSRPDQSLALK